MFAFGEVDRGYLPCCCVSMKFPWVLHICQDMAAILGGKEEAIDSCQIRKQGHFKEMSTMCLDIILK